MLKNKISKRRLKFLFSYEGENEMFENDIFGNEIFYEPNIFCKA